ncbi:MAG TPA: hypothetical protein VKP30_27645 [Polyangiaceae bacterium]|nr:hypothetical protein [Polyangiaceae bacterium]
MRKAKNLVHLQRFATVVRFGLRGVVSWLGASLVLSLAPAALAQTWANGRQRPSLREVATVDQTGEAAWLWGAEDVANNGLDQFPAEERAIDARSVYLRMDGEGRLWWRTYVSAESAPQNNLTAYLFVDADLNTATGLSAAATSIDPAFTTDPSAGGYEYVLSVRGDGSQLRYWALDATRLGFVETPKNSPEVTGESGVFLDPLRVGVRDHGYVQATITQSLLGINGQCQARFFVRTTNQTQNLGSGDLNVGEVVACVPVDTDQNSVPDIVEPDRYRCTSNDQCPAGGICRDGRCWLAPVCIDDNDCGANARCVDGSCIVVSGGGCRSNRECASGFCQNGQCVACTSNSVCGAGRVCAPDGRCVADDTPGAAVGGTGGTGRTSGVGGGIVLEDGERIQGGACACRSAGLGLARPNFGWAIVAVGIAALRGRRRGEKEPRR